MQLETDGVFSFQKFLRRKQIPHKVSFLSWDHMHNSVPTLSILRNNGIDIKSVSCNLCHQEEEVVDQLFVQCSYSHAIWMYFLRAFKMDWLMPSTLFGIFEFWYQCKLRRKCRDVWRKFIMLLLGIYGMKGTVELMVQNPRQWMN